MSTSEQPGAWWRTYRSSEENGMSSWREHDPVDGELLCCSFHEDCEDSTVARRRNQGDPPADTHHLTRSWCESRIRGSGLSGPHRRRQRPEHGLSVPQMDCLLVGSRDAQGIACTLLAVRIDSFTRTVVVTEARPHCCRRSADGLAASTNMS